MENISLVEQLQKLKSQMEAGVDPKQLLDVDCSEMKCQDCPCFDKNVHPVRRCTRIEYLRDNDEEWAELEKEYDKMAEEYAEQEKKFMESMEEKYGDCNGLS